MKMGIADYRGWVKGHIKFWEEIYLWWNSDRKQSEAIIEIEGEEKGVLKFKRKC